MSQNLFGVENAIMYWIRPTEDGRRWVVYAQKDGRVIDEHIFDTEEEARLVADHKTATDMARYKTAMGEAGPK
jgi:hypothetical protein